MKLKMSETLSLYAAFCLQFRNKCMLKCFPVHVITLHGTCQDMIENGDTVLALRENSDI